jgi:hypothetical protein
MLAPDIAAMKALIRGGEILEAVEGKVGVLT